MSIRPELRLDSKRIRFYRPQSTNWGSSIFLRDAIASALSCSRIELPQCEANADTDIVSTAVEHLHSHQACSHEGRCFRQEPKERLNLKRCGVVYDISKTQSFSHTAEVCDCTTRLFW